MVINNENFVIRKLNNDIISTLNASPAPIEAKRLILESALNLVTKEADKIVTYEIRTQKEGPNNGRLSENELAE